MRGRKKRKIDIKRLTIKFFLCIVYLVVITILLVGAYKLFLHKKGIVEWEYVETVDEYTYLEISKMSEKFAYYENENIGFHFVIEEKDTGEWHTYVIAIDEDDYNKYKDIIDYSYERIETVPDPVKVYGYPTIMSDELKSMILNHIGNFLPAENEVQITLDNLENYLTNSYLDTTKEKVDNFSIILFTILILLFVMIILLLFTIFDRDKIVDNIETTVDQVEYRTKKVLRLKILKKFRKKRKK